MLTAFCLFGMWCVGCWIAWDVFRGQAAPFQVELKSRRDAVREGLYQLHLEQHCDIVTRAQRMRPYRQRVRHVA